MISNDRPIKEEEYGQVEHNTMIVELTREFEALKKNNVEVIWKQM